MLRRLIFPILLGVVGCGILIGLGVWQVQRLAWKTEVINQISEQLTEEPVGLPESPNPNAHNHLSVIVNGGTVGEPIHVLVTIEGFGPGYRLISGFETDEGRRILVDLGYVPLEPRDRSPLEKTLFVGGNLHWPDEADSWTPEPDESGIWFARDVPAMAAALDTEEVMLVARTVSGRNHPFRPLSVKTSNIPNNHLNYAITWFSLALVWAIMTLFLINRTFRSKDP